MDFLGELLKRVGTDTFLAILAVIVVFDKTGVVQRWLNQREERRRSDREMLSEDTQFLIGTLRDTIDDQIRRQAAESAAHGEHVRRLEERLRERDEIIALNARGMSRYRHAFAAAATYIAALHDYTRRNGLAPPPFDGWREMATIDPDFADEISQILGADKTVTDQRNEPQS